MTKTVSLSMTNFVVIRLEIVHFDIILNDS